MPPPPLRLPADRLTPLGLVAAELVTDALKHGRGRGRLSVRPAAGVPGGVEVACEDEGPGLADDFDPRRSRGSGMRPIAALAKGPEPIRLDRVAPYARVAVTLTPGRTPLECHRGRRRGREGRQPRPERAMSVVLRVFEVEPVLSCRTAAAFACCRSKTTRSCGRPRP